MTQHPTPPTTKAARASHRIFNFVLIVALPIAYYGATANFLISNEFWNLMLVPSATITILTAIVLYRLLGRPAEPNASPEKAEDPIAEWIMKPRPLVRMFSAIALSTIIFPAMQLGVPAIAGTFLNGSTETAQLLVGKAEQSPVNKFCNRHLNVSHPDYGQTRLCGFPVSPAQPVVAGDKIKLSGQRTFFGLRYSYENCQLIKK